LVFKRALGSPYRRGEFTLRAFDRFLAGQPPSRGRVPLEKVVYTWLGREADRKPVTVAIECGVIRQFCLFRRRRHPTAFVPDRSWAPQATVSEFLPHVLTTAEVKALLRLAGALDRPRFRARVYRALLLILYCTGIRFGEALRLRLCDVDLDRGVLFIAESKGRARWVPFHHSLVREVDRYLVRRREYAPARPGDRLFVGLNGEHLPVSTASDTVRDLLRRAGLKPSSGRVGPRPYDLRHTFAVHRLTRWYRAGVDLHARLPWLSAYMGHDNILGTETYLTATPELVNVAARRMRGRFFARLRWP
jgi:integrase